MGALDSVSVWRGSLRGETEQRHFLTTLQRLSQTRCRSQFRAWGQILAWRVPQLSVFSGVTASWGVSYILQPVGGQKEVLTVTSSDTILLSFH
jgi:hypothetical protein